MSKQNMAHAIPSTMADRLQQLAIEKIDLGMMPIDSKDDALAKGELAAEIHGRVQELAKYLLAEHGIPGHVTFGMYDAFRIQYAGLLSMEV